MECASLREERDKLLEELRRLSSPSPTSSTAMDQEEDNSLGNISLLQQSFSALQVKQYSIAIQYIYMHIVRVHVDREAERVLA